MPATGSASEPRPSAWPFGLAVAPFLFLVWKFSFVTDDAFISFRYSKNLAAGLGLRYNVGVEPPVEGFTNFLWVIAMAVVELFGADIAFWSRAVSIACGVYLLFRLSRFLHRRVTTDPVLITGGLLFFGTLPAAALWTTGGLATMAFTLAIFVAFERLLGDPQRPLGVHAGLMMVLVSLIRADGPYFVVLIFCVAALAWLLQRPPDLMRAAVVAGAIFTVGMLAFFAFRYWYFGDFAPNTAYAKVGLSLPTLERGMNYVAIFMLSFLSIPLLGLLTIPLWGRPRAGVALQAALLVAGTFAYGILVGGDFMCMGRLLIPATPFLGVLFAAALGGFDSLRGGMRPATYGAIALAVVLSVLPGYDVHLVPESTRQRFHYRWRVDEGEFMSEYARWQAQKENSANWTELGLAIKRHTQPGETLLLGRIGAVGYFSDIFLFDRKGLVNREVARLVPPDERQSPGHDIRAPLMFFADDRPTYLMAQILPRKRAEKMGKRRFKLLFEDYPGDLQLTHLYESRVIPLDPEEGFAKSRSLWLVALRPNADRLSLQQPD